MTDQEINEAVARKLGWRFYPEDGAIKSYWHSPYEEKAEDPEYPEDTYTISSRCPTVKPYCNDIRAAWEIVEHLAKTKFPMVIYRDMDSGWGFKCDREAWASSAPMAICKAFLKLP